MITKKVVVGVMIFGIMLVSVGLISAGWFGDLFTFGEDDGGEGELAVSTDVTLEVTGAVPPPEIVWVSDLNSKNEVSVIAGDRALTGGTTTAKTFDVYVYSPGGVAALPTSPLASQVFVTLVYGGSTSQPGAQFRKSTTGCTHLGTVSFDSTSDDCNDPQSTGNCYGPNMGTVDVRQYRCSVNVQFYDNYGSSNYWEVKAYAQDVQCTGNPCVGHEDGYFDSANEYTNNANQPNRAVYHNRLESFSRAPIALDFGIVGYSADLDKTPTTDLSVTNEGNIDLDTINLQTYDIPDNPDIGDPQQTILSEWFYIDDDGTLDAPCDGTDTGYTSLITGGTYDSGVVSVAYGPSESSNVYTCLDKVEFRPETTTITYSTQGPGGTPWDVGVVYCTNPGCS